MTDLLWLLTLAAWLPAAFGIPFWSVVTWFTQERFTVVRGRGEEGGWGTLIWKGWAGMHVVNLNSRCLVLIDRTRERNGYRNGFFFFCYFFKYTLKVTLTAKNTEWRFLMKTQVRPESSSYGSSSRGVWDGGMAGWCREILICPSQQVILWRELSLFCQGLTPCLFTKVEWHSRASVVSTGEWKVGNHTGYRRCQW